MKPEELDKARGDEALRLHNGPHTNGASIAAIAARLAREGWTPPEPVDPDVLAYREWEVSQLTDHFDREEVLAGKRDRGIIATAFLAGARMARKQEQERAKVLLEYAEGDANRGDGAGMRATQALAAYKAGKAAQ
jgi:hypothetical protein